MRLNFLRKLHIGFYGHSAACWAGHPESFIDQVSSQLNAKIVNIGTVQGSEERVLFDLKKTKIIDVAVIFHSHTPRYIFLPSCDRDVSISSVPTNKAKVLWSESEERKNISPEDFEKEFSYGRIKEVFGDMDTFIETMYLHKKFLYHPDLVRNRYEGARCLIDLYCLKKVPKVIHVIDCDQEKIGNWFKFQSGIVDYELGKIADKYYSAGIHPNNLTDEGNIIMANKIVEILKEKGWHR
jgi:hypothetical protein